MAEFEIEVIQTKKVFDWIISHQKKGVHEKYVLGVDEQGNLYPVSTRDKQKLYSTKIRDVRKALEKKAHILKEMAKSAHLQNQKVQKYQDIVNSYYNENRLYQAPDLHHGLDAHWMGDMADELEDKTIKDMILPGTHDSGAYQIDVKHNVSKSGIDKFLNFICRIIPPIKNFIKNWTVTQEHDIKGQLEQGVRNFDFRVAADPEGEIYISHRFACDSLNKVLDQIEAFTRENPGEIVVINIKTDWDHRKHFKKEHGNKIIQMIEQKLAGRLLENDQSVINTMTYGEMCKTGRRILINNNGFPFSEIHTNNFVFKKKVRETWLNRIDLKEAENKLHGVHKKYQSNPERNILRNVSYTLTPTANEIKKAALHRFLGFRRPEKGKRNLRDLAATINKQVKPVLKKYNPKHSDRGIERQIDMISMDFPERQGVIQELIRLNKNRKNK